MQDTPIKRCTKCGNEFPATTEYFGVVSKRKDGLNRECRVCWRARHRHWNEMHRDAKRKADRESKRRYREQNPGIGRERSARSRAKYPEVWQAAKARTKARQRGLPATLTVAEWRYALSYFNNTCAVCQRAADERLSISLDHWVPLYAPGCPGSVAINCIPLCSSRRAGAGGCNGSKADKSADQWLIERFGNHQAAQILSRVETYFARVRSQQEAAG